MSFLTREQLDKYVKDLASKTPRTNSLKSPTRPLSSSISSSIGSSSISTDEKKVGTLHGPRSLPGSKRNSLPATTSPKASVFNNNIQEDIKEDNNDNNSSLNEITSAPIIESTVNDTISTNFSTESSNTSNINNDEKKSKYKNIDDIVNDLSYPMETKLSFKPITTTNSTATNTPTVNTPTVNTPTVNTTANNTTTTSSTPQSKGNNNISSPKGTDDPIKGSYVASAAFRSSYGAASRTPSIKKPVIQPSPKQEQREIASNKKQRDSTIQELQNRSNTNWSARYDEARQKYPPLNKLEKDKEIPSPPSSSLPPSQNKNNVTAGLNNRQTIRPTSSLNCASCGKPISGNVLSAMGKKWHPDHFVCKKCGITLEHVAFFERDGDPYCHLDYHELFSPRCGYCETPIEGQAINALGKTWHPEHFFCRECGNLFEGGFRVHDGFPYCDKDWMRLFAPKCKGCKEGIRGEFTSALDGMWHRDCFVCTTCKEPFHGSYYYVSEGKPYCDEHYKELLSIN
ncbi:paxillin-like isoform X3 [Rhizophagus clarus]|uniref:Paxillin-like isoform X3 n=1 Tax=Rhizophagus clarus TaxID=94130 RepID=A0A8H3R2A9_9GLOM|nr:paxillin-like isoform X3 [Rhizophagus clarus]